MVDFGVVLVERLVEFNKNPSRERDVNALSMLWVSGLMIVRVELSTMSGCKVC